MTRRIIMKTDETYLIPYFCVNRHQFNFFEALFDEHGMTSDEIAAFKQVFAYCFCVLGDLRLHCPMTKEYRRKHFHGISLDRICNNDHGPLKILRYPLVKGQRTSTFSLCQKYKIHPSITEQFVKLKSMDDERLNWMTGRRVLKPLMSRIWNKSGHKYPSPIIDALTVYNQIPKLYDHKAVLAKTDEMKRNGNADRGIRGESFLENVTLQIVTDVSSLPTPVQRLIRDNGFRPYISDYVVKESGRIYEIYGGTQNLPRELKRVAFDHPDIRNYDIVSSHPMILRQLMEDYNAAFPERVFDFDWLIDYTNGTYDKHHYAAQVGVSVDCWKTCLYAFFNAAGMKKRNKTRSSIASLPANHFAKEFDSFSIFDAIDESLVHEFPDEEQRLAEAQERFRKLRDVLSGFDNAMNQFLRALVGHALNSKSFSPGLLKIHKTGKARSISNACGLKKTIRGKDGGLVTHKVVRRRNPKAGRVEDVEIKVGARHVLSFLLQGAEAALIHRLTALGDKYGYHPLGNEHDGLIVLGKIPSAAITEAVAATGLRYTKLVEKGF